MKTLRKQPKRSLRTILILWFLLFSIVPITFIAIYSVSRFKKAIDNELSLRLSGNGREISTFILDYKSEMQAKRDRQSKDPSFLYHLADDDGGTLKGILTNSLRQDFGQSMTVFNREGKMLASVFKDGRSEIKSFIPAKDAVFLAARYIAHLKDHQEIGLVEGNKDNGLDLILISRINSSGGKVIGYLEQTTKLDKTFLEKMKSRLKLEMMIFSSTGKFVGGSHQDLYLYKNDFFRDYFKPNSTSFFDLNLRSVPYGFLVIPVQWDTSTFYFAVGASKSDVKEVLKNVNLAFFSVVGTVIALLIITAIFITSLFLKPLYELVDGLQSFESQEQAVTIPVKNDTEIGLLTESFNEMSKKIWTARADLRKKIAELEQTNRELKETQAKLVHSAKMVSLGQLVAGVAHELNNPIGFIYSNITHLDDYSKKLMELVEVAEKNPTLIKAKKDEIEFDYIKSDMPKLIASCQDGARRTKEIVLGLRNFSRLEAAKLQEVDLHQCLDTTLNLLQGEIKNRIEVHRNYEPIPTVYCYVSQINQVLMNILSNALQAMEGGGNIWISTTPLKGYADKKGRVKISIQDSGKGMTAETLEKIFDPFFTTKGVGQGTGLGLSISYGIVQNHGGEILVRSEVGVGTEFTIILPEHPPTQESK